jgi:hypothetical protein
MLTRYKCQLKLKDRALAIARRSTMRKAPRSSGSSPRNHHACNAARRNGVRTGLKALRRTHETGGRRAANARGYAGPLQGRIARERQRSALSGHRSGSWQYIAKGEFQSFEAAIRDGAMRKERSFIGFANESYPILCCRCEHQRLDLEHRGRRAPPCRHLLLLLARAALGRNNHAAWAIC